MVSLYNSNVYLLTFAIFTLLVKVFCRWKWKSLQSWVLKLSRYSIFHYGDAQQDSFEYHLLPMNIMDKGFVPYSTD